MITHTPGKAAQKKQSANNLDTNLYVLARQALYEYIQQENIQKVILPSFCALGAYLPYLEAGVNVEFYDYDENLHIKIQNSLESYSKSLFHYIHPYGLYIKENIDFLSKNKHSFLNILDDRALTLTIKPYESIGMAELYSIYKLTDAPVGGFCISDTKYNKIDYPEAPSKEEQIFIKKDKLFNSFIAKKCNILGLKLLLKLNKNNIDISTIENSFIRKATRVSKNTAEIISHLDMEGINKSICDNNKYLFEQLNPKYHIARKEAYTSQATIGFPIIVDSQRKFHDYLTAKGILGFTLKNGWQIESRKDPFMHSEKHYCLPNSYSLEHKDLDKIIKVVNNYK